MKKQHEDPRLIATPYDTPIEILTTRLLQTLKMLPLSSLKLSERNQRTHNWAQIDVLVNSVRPGGKAAETDTRNLKVSIKEE